MSVPARRRVAGVWLVLAGLVAIVAAVEYAEVVARSPREDSPDAQMLVSGLVEELAAIELVVTGRLHRFERDAAGVWFYHGVHTGSEGSHAHATDRAAGDRIERAVAAFARTRIERRLARGPGFGVTTPEMLILLYRPNESQPLAQLAVGDVAPDTVSRYVDVVGGAGVVTIPNYQIDNLLALVQSVTSRSAIGGASPLAR